MRKFFFRSGLVLLLFFLEMNFFNLFFFQAYAVNFSILLVIAWVVSVDFEKVWWPIFLLGFLHDLILSQKIGLFIIFFLCLAYAIGLVSKKFIIEKRFSGFLLVIIFILVGLWMGEMLDIFLDNGFNFPNIWIDLKNNYFGGGKIFWSSLLAIICFYPVYKTVNNLEKYLSRLESRLRISL